MSTQIINNEMILKWSDEKLGMQEVMQKLDSLEIDEVVKDAYLKAFKKEKNSRRQFRGFVYLGIGAFLGFLSCVLTLINPVPELYNWILFGLTSVSVLILFLGLYNIFE